jgi:hypothetical protein
MRYHQPYLEALLIKFHALDLKMSSKRVAGLSNRSPSPPPIRRKLESTTTSMLPEKYPWSISSHNFM